MSSFNKNNPSSFDGNQSFLLQSLMGRLQIRPPYLHTNSFLSHSLDDFLSSVPNPLSFSDDETDEQSEDYPQKTNLSKEESKVEKEVIRTILSGNTDSLKPNSGQSVSIGEHHICVGFHDEADYRVWEWHGHVMIFDDENGYSPEYIYGNYFERVVDKQHASRPDKEREREVDEEEKESGGDPGLRGLIGGDGDSSTGRILRRNVNVGSTNVFWAKMRRIAGGWS